MLILTKYSKSVQKSLGRSAFYAVCILMLFSSCVGGGSRGTGTVRNFAGFILDAALQPLSGVKVTIEETGDSVLTGVSGGYFIKSSVTPLVTYVFEKAGKSIRYKLAEVSTEMHRVEIDVKLDFENDRVSVLRVEMAEGLELDHKEGQLPKNKQEN